MLALGSNDGKIYLRDVYNAQETKFIKLEGHTMRINSLAFSPRGDILVSGGSDGKIILRPLEGSEPTVIYAGRVFREYLSSDEEYALVSSVIPLRYVSRHKIYPAADKALAYRKAKLIMPPYSEYLGDLL